jgi:hypothetical protein
VSRVLAADVWVQRDEKPTLLAAGSALPSWAKGLVTHPRAFVEGPADDSEERAEKKSDAPVAPPREGRGSGDKQWATYAKAIGLEVSSGKKADIIAALDARNAQGKEAQAKAYADMTDEELVDMARERELPNDVARAELIEALEFDDLEREESAQNENEE